MTLTTDRIDDAPEVTTSAPHEGAGGRADRVRRRLDDARREPMTPAQVIGTAVSMTLAALAVWSVVYLLVLSNLQHERAQHQKYATLRSQLALATAPIGGVIPAGTPVAAMSVPGAGLQNEVVSEGTTSGVLRDGPGHVRTTPLPGQPGTSVIYGRALTFGGPFADVPDLARGAVISVVTDQGRFRFAVTGVRRTGDPLTVPSASAARLTLVTSNGGWRPDQVVYVDAVLLGKPAADPGGRPTQLSDQETLMKGEHDPLTLVQVVLWLQLLLLVVATLVWLARRWGRWQLWLVATPGLLAVLWGLSNTASRLLPNLL